MGYWRTYFSTAEEIGLGRHGEEMEMDRWATSSGGGKTFLLAEMKSLR